MAMKAETLGWRGKFGFISPAGDWRWMPEIYPLLPEGVLMTVTTLGVQRLRTKDAEKVFKIYPEAAKHLATQNCSIIIAAGALVFSLLGYDRSQEMMQKVRETIETPIITDLDAHFESLKALSAKKIILVSPYEEARNEERVKICEQVGFQVVNSKGLGVEKRVELGQLPFHATYTLSKEAYLETPGADAIYISCPEWPTIKNIERIEQDTGIPVVSHVTGFVYSALKAMHIKGPIRGYGRLLELL